MKLNVDFFPHSYRLFLSRSFSAALKDVVYLQSDGIIDHVWSGLPCISGERVPAEHRPIEMFVLPGFSVALLAHEDRFIDREIY